jgi:ring-1,2-phenylacetyl-CoA epoxidase subunit PaaD
MATATLEAIRSVAGTVVDPEIPVLTIDDLGILRDVRLEAGTVVVTITPTYSGCPAMGQIEDDLVSALARAGHPRARIETIYHPAWTTDWISPEGHRKLAGFGIAPPTPPGDVQCPRCEADQPRTIAQFGSTACKALMVCSSCGEPFDYFKTH